MAAVLQRRPGSRVSVDESLDTWASAKKQAPCLTNGSDAWPQLFAAQRHRVYTALIARALEYPSPVTVNTHIARLGPDENSSVLVLPSVLGFDE